jgi:hypothetical protein
LLFSAARTGGGSLKKALCIETATESDMQGFLDNLITNHRVLTSGCTQFLQMEVNLLAQQDNDDDFMNMVFCISQLSLGSFIPHESLGAVPSEVEGCIALYHGLCQVCLNVAGHVKLSCGDTLTPLVVQLSALISPNCIAVCSVLVLETERL